MLLISSLVTVAKQGRLCMVNLHSKFAPEYFLRFWSIVCYVLALYVVRALNFLVGRLVKARPDKAVHGSKFALEICVKIILRFWSIVCYKHRSESS